jgi:wobble nucleotide-excising tRNase
LKTESFHLFLSNPILTLNKNLLDKGQAKEVLSQGEKNIIAFAYFLGDVHLKVESEDDYEKVFFILDDPISSMDYHHVYTVNQVIKDLKEITKVSGQIRFIIFTHHLDFMRVLVGNNTVKKSLVLKNSEIKAFNNNLTIPYILHLQDIYRISQEIEEPNHTTPNSIRHIIETLTKFENIVADEGEIGNYIKENFPDDSRTYTLIQDLSHGGWRTEQSPIHSDSIVDVCKAIINLVDKKYKGQVEYCRSLV